MAMKYEDLQSLEREEKSQGLKNGLPAPQVLLQHLCSGPRPLLLSLGLSLLLLVGICVIGSKSSKIQRDLETLRATCSNVTSHTVAEVQALHAQGGRLRETITSLQVEVEKQGQQLQAARSLNDTVFSLESQLEKGQQELKAGYSDLVLRVQEVVKYQNSLNSQVASLKSNGSQKTCCPVNWLEHEGSCYLFSGTKKPWPEAEESCQLQNAHLVVVGSWEEQKFLEEHTSYVNTWIGLTDQHGPWTWVDGTDYETGFNFWSPEQPDNWRGHQSGESEDCAHFTDSGRWNDNDCTKPFRWVCEIKLDTAS
ncbi:C-type lectin domain family 10 member A-like [Pteronotus mesoamericanus]|uniref:C-type lectin domain family 10 member A-like n=1 Tax=Pteronotus mesoamericanus TaxID=1884717 RepID=UPI0023EC530A|nr:C-type lectin domain family 10 member A-like [Pteronotus parnellii mesoamericanus]